MRGNNIYLGVSLCCVGLHQHGCLPDWLQLGSLKLGVYQQDTGASTKLR